MRRIARLGVVAVFAIGGWTAGAAAVAAPAAACNIPTTGGSCAPSTITVSSSSTVVDSRSATLNNTQGSEVGEVMYTETVYRNPSNGLCANCLTWVLQVLNLTASTEFVASATISDFGGWQTDIGTTASAPGYTTNPADVAPIQVSRSSAGNGKVVRWCFGADCGGVGLAPGQTTQLLAVDTNSTAVIPGTVTVQNGVTNTGPGLSPAVPEAIWVPALGLFGGAIAGGYAVRNKRKGRSRTVTP